MNKFKTDINGKLPFVLDDIRYLDDAYRSAILSIAKALSNSEDIIMSGLLLQPIQQQHILVIHEGFVVIDDEIRKVSQTVLPWNTAHDDIYIRKKNIVNSAGRKVFGDGTLHDTYYDRIAEIIVTSSPLPGDLQYSTAKRLDDIWELAINKNTAFNKDFGNTQGTVAEGNHTHDSVYEQKSNNPNALITRIINIGAWDMDAIDYVDVAYPYTSIDKMISVSVLITNNAGSGKTDLLSGGRYDVVSIGSSKHLRLFRDLSGRFDSPAYGNGSTINRGVVLITFLP